jgi:hypothetical protein
VAACRAILEFSCKVAEIEDLQQRLERLEQIARSPEKGNDYDHPISAAAPGTAGKANGHP